MPTDHSDSSANPRGTSRKKWIVLLVLVLPLICISSVVWIQTVFSLARASKEYRAQREILINEVDHQAVCAAARSLLADPTLASEEGTDLGGADSVLPPEIRSLKPVAVRVEADKVVIEFDKSLKHYGLLVRPAGQELHWSKDYACTELTDGMWLFEEVRK